MSEPDYARIAREMAAHGLVRRSSCYDICCRVVAGKRCLLPYGKFCRCREYRWLFDHGHMWRAGGRRHVLSGDPYHIEQEMWNQLIAHCAELGLREPKVFPGVWFPGYTKLILVGPRA